MIQTRLDARDYNLNSWDACLQSGRVNVLMYICSRTWNMKGGQITGSGWERITKCRACTQVITVMDAVRLPPCFSPQICNHVLLPRPSPPSLLSSSSPRRCPVCCPQPWPFTFNPSHLGDSFAYPLRTLTPDCPSSWGSPGKSINQNQLW